MYSLDDLGLTGSLFTVANGYLGMRGTTADGYSSGKDGTFVNGLHDTSPITHMLEAFGLARDEQTIIDAPDSTYLRLYVDGEPLRLPDSGLTHYERVLDFRTGVLSCDLVWKTAKDKRVRVQARRMISLTERHFGVMTLEVSVDRAAEIRIASRIVARQGGIEEDRHSRERKERATVLQPGFREPRESAAKSLLSLFQEADGNSSVFGFRCDTSGMNLGIAVDHIIDTDNVVEAVSVVTDGGIRHDFTIEAQPGRATKLTKLVSYHSSPLVRPDELAHQGRVTLERIRTLGVERQFENQRDWLAEFWRRSDVEIEDQEALQQAVRFSLFSLAQAGARVEGHGIPSRGVTGRGNNGHYTWDVDIYTIPFFVYTTPQIARSLLHFRFTLLPAAKSHARKMSTLGALFPPYTINGDDASVSHVTGTAQYHVNADISYALVKYLKATKDTPFLIRAGLETLVETSRFFADLGFWRSEGSASFHMHAVTGPDEYTTVVNNNLFTNVMARFNLEQAADAVDRVREEHPEEFARIAAQLNLRATEVTEWRRCAKAMYIPFDEGLGIHPQDDFFLDREVWDLSRTPDELLPIALHYHPLVISRFQVIKQAEVVLAIFLQGERFTSTDKRRNYEYYDPITTGDSPLSAIAQSIVAAEVGYHRHALAYFRRALFTDLADVHGDTADGLHIANAGGVWAALVYGFGGLRDYDDTLSFDPRLPEGWAKLTFRVRWHGSRLRVSVSQDELRFAIEKSGPASSVPISVRGSQYTVGRGDGLRVPLVDQGPRLESAHTRWSQSFGRRADDSWTTAEVPDPIPSDRFDSPFGDDA